MTKKGLFKLSLMVSLGWSGTNSSVGWLEMSKLSTQPISYLYYKEAKQHKD